jgi:hypothetical protein
MKNISLKTISGLALARKTALFLAAVAFVATFAASQAQAAEFAVIIANLNDAKDPQAQIDVAVDTQALPGGAPATVYFNVFGASGSQIAEFEVLTNQNGFASSSSAAPPYDNLFTVSGGLPALVTVRTPGTASIAGVVLRQKSKESEVVVDVPRVRRVDGSYFAAGRVFSVPVGDIVHTATLLIANVFGTDIAVDLFIGTKGAPGGGKYNNPRILNNGLWIVDIDPADMDSHLIVSSTGAVIVQLAIDDSKKGALNELLVMPVQ